MDKASMSCKIANNSLEAMGDTPMIYLNRISEGCCAKIAAKLEYVTPACSVNDRIASAMITVAEQEGKIEPGLTTIIEATSNDIGISLAQVAAIKGYNLILVMPENVSTDRLIEVMAFGAEVVLTRTAGGMKGATEKARDLAERIPNSFILNQFKNAANPQAHFETTGPEIWQQTGGKVDIGVFGIDTAGLLSGVGQYLLQKNPAVKIFACELEGLCGKKSDLCETPGTGVGYASPVLDTTLYKGVIRVQSNDAIAMTRRLAREEGILTGISSGANVYAAVKLAKESENEGKLIVTALTSFGEHFLSSSLYSDVREKAERLRVEKTEESLVRIPFTVTSY